MSESRVILTTDRLLIRAFEYSDALALATFYSDPETMKFMGGVRTLPQTKKKLQEIISYFEKDGFGVMAIVLKGQNCLIGSIGFLHQNIDTKEEIELGYLIGRPFCGHGYASEATQATLMFGLDKLKFPRLISIIHPENTASIRVAEKMSMRYEKDSTYKGVKVRIYATSN